MKNYRRASKNEEPCKSCHHHIPNQKYLNWVGCRTISLGLLVNLKYRCDHHQPYMKSHANV